MIETQKRQAQAALAQAKAALELARLNLSYTEIRSPIDGVIGNRHVRVGDYAMVGANSCPSSRFPACMWTRISRRARSRICARSAGGHRSRYPAWRRFQGTVESLAPATGAQFSLLPAENATGNFTKIVQRVPIRIRLEGEAGELGRLRPACRSSPAWIDADSP